MTAARPSLQDIQAPLQDVINSAPRPLLILDAALGVRSANRAFYEAFRLRPEETLGRRLQEMGGGRWDLTVLRARLEEVMAGGDPLEDLEVVLTVPGLGPRTLLLSARAVAPAGGPVPLLVLGADDVTEARATAARLARAEAELARAQAERRLSDALFLAQYRRHPLPTYVWRRRGDTFVLVDANDAADAATGGNVQGLFGNTVEDLYGDDPAMCGCFAECFRSQHNAVRQFWYRLRSTGERKYLITTFVFVPPDTVMVHTEDATERRRAEEALAASERRLAEAQRIARLGSWDWNIQTGEVHWSDELLRMTGRGEAPAGEAAWVLVHPGDAARVRQEVTQALAGGDDIDFESRLLCADGREITVHNWGRVVRDAAGRPLRLVAVAQDVTEQRQTEAALRESRGHLQAIAEATPASIVITRVSDGTVLYANPFARQLFGVAPDADLSAYHASDFYQDPADRDETVRLLALYPLVGPRELAVKRMDGRPIWAMGSFQRLTFGGEEAVLATHHDITARRQVEAERERLLAEAQERADRDPLTGLLNHRAFQRRMEEEAGRAEREGTPLAVVMLDLDNFKFFNDVYGHTVGDEVLRLVAERLRAACRHEDVLARYGGDEFALILPDVGGSPCREIEAQFRARVDGLTYRPAAHAAAIPIPVSVGASTHPCDGQPWQEVVGRADERLRRAKASGSGETEAGLVRASMLKAVAGYSLLDALVAAVDNKDRYTRRHSEDVMAYSLMMARELGLTDVQQHTVAVSALLHDVGKIGVPDHVLRKPGKLTDEEFEAVRQHPQMGAIIVQAVPGLEDTLEAVRHHHERWDGEGYPLGLPGEETPLVARLMAVADAFSAMTTDRPYHKAMAHDRAASILEAGAGTQWDPACVRAFLRAWRAEQAG